MGVYLIRCDTQRFQEIYADYLTERGDAYRPNLDAQIHWSITETQAGCETAGMLTLKVEPAKHERSPIVKNIVGFMGICEIFILLFLLLKGSALWFLAVVFGGLGVAAFFCFLFTFVFTSLELGTKCNSYEILLHRFLTIEGISPRILLPPRNGIGYRGNLFVLFSSLLVFLFVQFVVIYDLWLYIVLLSPLFLLMIVFALCLLFHMILSSILYDRINGATFLHLFWRMEILRLTWHTASIYICPLGFYIAFYLLGRFGIATALMPLSPPLSSDQIHQFFFIDILPYFNNPDALRVGYVEWILGSNFYAPLQGYINMSAFLVIAIGGFFIMVVAIIGQFIVGGMFFVGQVKWWDEFELLPGIIPKDMKDMLQETSSNGLRGAFAVEWGAIGIFNVACTGVVILGLLISWNILPAWIPLRLAVPFIWYLASFQGIFGSVFGIILARMLLIVLFFPVLMWLLFWGYSLFKDLAQLRIILFPQKRKHPLQDVVNDICKQFHFAPPTVQIDNAKAEWPTTFPVLPFARFCVIRISDAFIEKFTSEEVRIILTHELAHVRLHMWRLWVTQTLSRLSFMGSGTLTILLNSWKMEIDADAFAAVATNSYEELITLLKRSENISEDLKIEAWMKFWAEDQQEPQKTNRPQSQNKDTTTKANNDDLFAAYKIYFGDTIWGAAHPPYQVRIEKLLALQSEFTSNRRTEALRFPLIAVQPLASPTIPASRSFSSKGRVILFVGLALLILASSVGTFYVIQANKVASSHAIITATARANSKATAVAFQATGTAQAVALATKIAVSEATAASEMEANPYGGRTLALYDPLRDSFNSSTWDSNDNPGNGCWFSGGAYHIGETSSNNLHYCFDESTNFSDFAFEVQMKIVKGDCGGLVFRYDKTTGNNYTFIMCWDGTYALDLIKNYTYANSKRLRSNHSSAINLGTNATNLIAVVANGNKLDLYLNKKKIDSITDSTNSYGTQIGLLALNINHPTEVVYSNAKVWTFY